jgi:hypothetical protein
MLALTSWQTGHILKAYKPRTDLDVLKWTPGLMRSIDDLSFAEQVGAEGE